jgi:hypothetical protein
MILVRILASVLLLCLGLMMPWWLFVTVGLLLLIVFPWYIEFVVIAGLLDSIFAVDTTFNHVYIIVTLGMMIVVWIVRRYFVFA